MSGRSLHFAVQRGVDERRVTLPSAGLISTRRRCRRWGILAAVSLWSLACQPSPARPEPTGPDAGAVEDQDAVVRGGDDAARSDIADIPSLADAAKGAPALPCPGQPDLNNDLQHLDLALDLATHRGVAIWRIAPSKSLGIVSFEAGGLSAFTANAGLSWVQCGAWLHVQLPASTIATTIELHYTFAETDSMTGLMKAGSSVTWPTHCGNLFPCQSAPAEGFSYTLKVTGLPDGEVAVFPSEVVQQVPAYAVALAHGAYTYHVVGKAESGLELGVWLKPDQLGRDGKLALPSLADWPKAVSWLEATLGPYPLGKKLAAVTVPWGPMAYGGLEMHPIYHVSDLAIGDLAVHCHESAHGWFGNGVRIACWEDLVLSEGVADYLMVRAMAAAKGDQLMKPMFAAMEKSLASKAGTSKDIVVWQPTCNKIDVEASGVSSKITYHKGALFLRAVAQQVGYDKLDAALGTFVGKHLGTAQSMAALLDEIETATGFDPRPLAKVWLQSKGDPLLP